MYHYKDKNPKKTISTIKGILNRLGIRPVLLAINTVQGKVYSCRLRLPISDFDIGTNGKGINRSLALAGAYAEFMERLQNQHLYETALMYRLDKDFVRKFGFYHAPDEKYLSMRQLLSALPEELPYLYFSKEAQRSGTALTKHFLRKSVFTHNGKHIVLPYYSFKRKKIVDIPLAFCSETNGMCAGNSREEALTQGISEILERYVMHELSFKSINPPAIPDEYLRKYFPEMYVLIKNLEKKEGLRFIIKDCSLNGLFPVIGVIMLNRNRSGYYVRFGAHPVLSIAIERAFTELFQGRKLADFPYVPFEFFHDRLRESDKWLAWCKNFRDGSGSYQSALFSDNFSYPFSMKNPPRVFNNNHECFSYLLRLLTSLNWDILARNVSFLGFPSYHVIIPKAILGCFNRCPDKKPGDFYQISDLLRKLRYCSANETEKILKYFERLNAKGARDFFSKSLNIPLKNTEKLEVFNELLPAALYFKLGRLSEAHAHLKSIIEANYAQSKKHTILYRCARDFIGMSKTKMSINEIFVMLRDFYSGEQISIVADLFLADIRPFREFTNLPCPNCSKCASKALCNYPAIKKLHIRIKQAMRKNKLSQATIKKAFSKADTRAEN